MEAIIRQLIDVFSAQYGVKPLEKAIETDVNRTGHSSAEAIELTAQLLKGEVTDHALLVWVIDAMPESKIAEVVAEACYYVDLFHSLANDGHAKEFLTPLVHAERSRYKIMAREILDAVSVRGGHLHTAVDEAFCRWYPRLPAELPLHKLKIVYWGCLGINVDSSGKQIPA